MSATGSKALLPRVLKAGRLLCVLTALLCACGGCGTSGIQRLSASGPGWQTRQGQAVWKPGRNRPELSGDLALAWRADGSFVFDFSKTPMPMAHGQATATNWRIEFPAAKLSFGGRGPAPARFAWLHLQEALEGRLAPGKFVFTRRTDGGWRLENPGTGEFIEGYLDP